MEKKIKEALIGYLNNVIEVYRLYTQDSFSDEDFLTGAVTDWSLDIMEECINDIDVKSVLKLMREAVTEGTRISDLQYNDDRESDDIATYDRLTAETERLKAKIEHPEPLKVEAGIYEITYNITGRGGATMEIMEGEEAADILELYLLDTGMNLDDRKVTITGIKKA